MVRAFGIVHSVRQMGSSVRLQQQPHVCDLKHHSKLTLTMACLAMATANNGGRKLLVGA